MRVFTMLVFLLVWAAGPIAAADTNGPMKAVRQFVDGLNTNHIPSALAACAPETSIIDEFAPYSWHGAGACAMWAQAFGAEAKKYGITNPVVALGTVKHADMTATHAYVVVPASYTYKVHGKATAEIDATMTFALVKTTGWHIVAWTWSKP